jgi:putative membrane protein
MTSVFDSLAQGFPLLVFYLLAVAAIFVIALYLYVKLTPHNEFKLVGEGNMAAAIHLSSLIIALSLPLAACLIYKVSILDVAMWGTLSVALQLFLFRMTDMIFRGIPDLIERDVAAPVLVLASTTQTVCPNTSVATGESAAAEPPEVLNTSRGIELREESPPIRQRKETREFGTSTTLDERASCGCTIM